jgi:hypothetical protein
MDIHFSKGILFLQWINFASLWTFSCQFVGWCISLLYSLDLFLDFDYIYTLRNCSFKRNLSNQAFLFLQLCSWYSLYYHVHFRIRLSISAKKTYGTVDLDGINYGPICAYVASPPDWAFNQWTNCLSPFICVPF